MVVLKPNVVRGGRAIGLGNNLYLMKGRTHSKGGIDIGKNPKTGLEVENNEVMQVSPQGVRVFSAQPILGGISPAQYILGGANPNQVFNAQEQWKKINRINDDGTKKARFGTEKDSKRDSAQVNIFRQSQDNSKVQANRIAHRKSLEKFIKDNPNLYGINTADFVDFMLDNATMESNNSPTASHGSMYGYYQLKGLKKGSTEEQQHRAAYKHLSNLFKNVITDADIEKAKELGISQAQLLHKFWNQERKVLNYLYQGKDDEDGLGTKISEWGNNNNLEIDYSPYVMKSFNDRNYIIKKGDNPETIMKRYRGVGNETRTFNDYEKDAADIFGLDYSKPLQVGQELSVDRIGARKPNGSFKYGGIHIKPSKRGTFTAAAKKHGMSVQGFASKVLANKGKYSSAMVKKANFARNASKWKHKEFGGDMDFNYWITKDNIYKLGGRKKALIGDDILQGSLIVANNGSNLDAARNKVLSSLPTTKSILTSFRDTLTPVEQKINKEQALRTIMSNQKDGLGTSGLSKGVVGQYLTNGIQAGINIAGNIGSYLINRDAIRRMRGPAAPLPLRAETLPTRVSTAAQEAALRENVAKQENLLAGNLSSSRSRLNATNRIRNQGIGLYNQLQDRKGEIERELITRDKLNRQGITNQNIAQVNQWRNTARDFENKRIDLNSENTIQHLVQGPADAIAGERGFFDNLASNDRYRMTAFLEAIKSPDALNAMNSDEIKQLARRFGVRTSWLRSIGINI